MTNHLSSPVDKLTGHLTVPGDKSISHRALIFNALCCGNVHIQNFLHAEDTLATLAALQSLGVEIDELGNGNLQMVCPAGQFKPPAQPLNLKNSGTGARLLCGLLAGSNISATITGDNSLQTRPMLRIIDPLTKMGVQFESVKNCLPLYIQGNKQLQAINYTMPVASAQVKSTLLLAALQAAGASTIVQPDFSRDHSERMLRAMGYEFESVNKIIKLKGKQHLNRVSMIIPGDFSSAAFFIVAGLLVPNTKIKLIKVGINPTRTALLTVLEKMGAKITLSNQVAYGFEPVADILVESSKLHGIEIPIELVPNLIDEVPALLLAAASAKGKTVLRGASELRVKESDRLHAMAVGLCALGVEVNESTDGMIVTGGKMRGGEVDSFADHRIAMTFLLAGAIAKEPVLVKNTACVASSYPQFVEHAQYLGFQIRSS